MSIDNLINRLKKNIENFSSIYDIDIQKKDESTLVIYLDDNIITYTLGERDIRIVLDSSLLNKLKAEDRYSKIYGYVSDLYIFIQEAEEINDQIDMTISDIEMDEEY